MRFVENHRGVLRQDAAEIVAAQREISEEKMMVHDDQIRFRRALSRFDPGEYELTPVASPAQAPTPLAA